MYFAELIRIYFQHHIVDNIEYVVDTWLGEIITVGAISRAMRLRRDRYRFRIQVPVPALLFENFLHHESRMLHRRRHGLLVAWNRIRNNHRRHRLQLGLPCDQMSW